MRRRIRLPSAGRRRHHQTDIADRPTAPRSAMSISMPTPRSRRMTPSSPRTLSVSFDPTNASSDGPMMTPATISPTTAGTLTRSASSAASFAAMRTMRMSRRTDPTSMASGRSADADGVAGSRSSGRRGTQSLRPNGPQPVKEGPIAHARIRHVGNVRTGCFVFVSFEVKPHLRAAVGSRPRSCSLGRFVRNPSCIRPVLVMHRTPLGNCLR